MPRLVTAFVGPSLPPTHRPTHDFIDYRPPARAGDMLALAGQPPHAVLLIDGLFERERAPWHKEILVLLSSGFDVWGAASLGALRAAELCRYGMQPHGAIAAAYCDGRIFGDDEVAVAHAPAALGHRALSIAQVDVRATLVGAVRRRILQPRDARALRSLSRGIHFKERTWPVLLGAARSRVDVSVVDRFAAWLPAGAVDQKEIDALGALAAIASGCAPLMREPPPETVFLYRLRDEISERPPADSARTGPSRQAAQRAGEA